jgi:peptide/nickel transport system substrate-binding protein
VVSVDVDSRSNSLQAGEFDVMHTANADTIDLYLGDDGFETTATSRYGDTGYIMLNVAEGDADPEGTNAASPLLNVNCRRALAYAIDQQRLADERGAGLVGVANGPFPPGSIGWLEDTGYPSYDVDKANEELDTCLAALGADHIEFSFNTTNDPFNVETNTLILSMWQEAFGDQIDAEITPIEQGQYIGLGLNGTFQILGWRSHSGSDPDQQRRWWHSSTAQPIGAVGTNFGRFVDPVIDENLDSIRTNADPEARREAAEAINRRFGEQVYNLWLNYALWAVITQPQVNGVEVNVLPGGGNGPGVYFGGRHQMPQLWCDGGDCG